MREIGRSSHRKKLLALHLGSHLSIEFLEAFSHALLGSHLLLDAAGDAARLAGGESPGSEVVDAGGEAGVNQVAVDLWFAYHPRLALRRNKPTTDGLVIRQEIRKESASQPRIKGELWRREVGKCRQGEV